MVEHAAGFRFIYESDLTPMLYRIRSIGREKAESAAYRWDGLDRSRGGFVFQYTLRGAGCIAIRDEPDVTVGVNQGFIVPIPSEHCYFYDKDISRGEPWEFIWIRLDHPEIMSLSHNLTGILGTVFEIKPDAEPIKLLQDLYVDVLKGDLHNDPYAISIRAYEWIVAMLRFASGRSPKRELPAAFQKALLYIDQQFADPIGLEDMAAVAGLNKHHFCQAFTKRIGYSPREYLLRRRMEEAALLLKRTELPIGAIALQSGFSDAGYFGKVFRKRMGMTPNDYRFASSDSKKEQVRFVD